MSNPEAQDQELIQKANIVLEAYKDNANKSQLIIGEDPGQAGFERSILETNIYVKEFDGTIETATVEEKETYLASTIKTAITYLSLATIVKNPEEADFDNTYIEMDFALVRELMGTDETNGRSFDRIMTVLESGQRFPDKDDISARYLGLKEGLIKYFNEKNKPVASFMQEDNLENNARWEQLLNALKEIPEKDFDKIKFQINLREFCELTINLSSNVTTERSRMLLLQEYGSNEGVRAALQELVPGLKNTYSTISNAHWKQPDANIGKISEINGFLEFLWNQSQKGDMVAELILGDMSKGHTVNKGKGWRHDFSTTETARILREEGVEIYEKTGYVPIEYWVLDLSGKGPHMSLSTAALLVFPDGRKFTIAADMSVAMPYTDKVDPEDGVDFPAFDINPYKDWAQDLFKNHAAPYFRRIVEEKIKEIMKSREN